MGRSTARKITPKHSAMGGAAPADFKGGDFELHGFWIHPTRRLTVEVPIFQHGFYPKLEHTDLDIEKQIQYRMVQMPSLSDLRKAGIQAEKAVFVAEVWVHPRYIKHWNYFRNDFPANMKTLVKQSDLAMVLPANDMPFARWKRKNVLAFWRAAFTPLFIEGKHYTSGRMSMFFVAPPHVTQGFRQKLNLEHDEDFNNLLEWDPTMWRMRKKLEAKRRSDTPHTKIAFGIRDEEVTEASERLERDVGPLITSKLGVDPRSQEGRAIMAVIRDKELSRQLLAKTQNKSNRLPAIKNWVRYNLWPRVKDFMSDQGAELGHAMVNFAFQTTVSIAVNAMFDKLKGRRPITDPKVAARYKRRYPMRYRVRQAAEKFDYRQSQYATSTGVGAGTLSFKFRKSNARDREQLLNILKTEALRLYKRRSGDNVGPIGKEFINIRFTPGDDVKLSLDIKNINHYRGEVPDVCGYFQEPEWTERAKNYLRMAQPDLNTFYQEIKMGEE